LPALPPRPVIRNPPGPVPPPINPIAQSLELKDAEWYWANITRDDVKDKLLDAVDGSFLVRDATNIRGEYTLTVKKDASDRVIRIYHVGNKYGFTQESCTFSSVVELIDFYRTTSLKQHNHILDIRLMYPISRSTHDEDYLRCTSDKNKLVADFDDTHTEYTSKTKEFELLTEAYNKNDSELDVKRHAYEMFREAEQIFQDQIRVQERYEGQAQPHEISGIHENKALLVERLYSLKECKSQLELDMERQKLVYKGLEREINSKRTELVHIMKQLDTYRQ
jgi:phosphoinositide-3-kinase regulatory subunit alpha/beta/delta